jgi:hypothetical protein
LIHRRGKGGGDTIAIVDFSDGPVVRGGSGDDLLLGDAPTPVGEFDFPTALDGGSGTDFCDADDHDVVISCRRIA